jgi:hypothetical protein
VLIFVGVMRADLLKAVGCYSRYAQLSIEVASVSDPSSFAFSDPSSLA